MARDSDDERATIVQWVAASALVVLAVAAFVFLRLSRRDDAALEAALADTRSPARAPRPAPARQTAAVAAATPQLRVRRERKAKKTEEPTFTRLAPGERAGLAVFPPPGTKPVKQGIIVPDDFELPEGYVRHYQTTDDGRRLPPILMFHPDYEAVDGNGNPVSLPADRIVPPEMAPRGMPLRSLDDVEHAGDSARPGGMIGGPPPR